MTSEEVAALLRKYKAQHTAGCPEGQQAYWRMRPEYRRRDWGPDKPCTCGLDDLVGEKGWRVGN